MNEEMHRIVRASAGTGKTFTLSSRYLDLLFDGAMPESILATTFTRKAAGEILDRVLLRLAQGAGTPVGARKLSQELERKERKKQELDQKHCQETLSRVCDSLHRLSISTIDGFFHRVARSFRHELGLPVKAVMTGADDPRMIQARWQAIEALLADDEPQVLIDLLRRLHHDAAQRSVTEAIDAIVSQLYEIYRQAPQEELWKQLQIPPGRLEAAEETQAVNALCGLALDEGWGKLMIKTITKDREHALSRAWGKFVKSGLGEKIANGEETYSKKQIPAAVVEAYQPLLAHARASLLERVARQTAATHQLLARFDQHFTQLRERQQLLLFSDLPQKLARELPRIEHLQQELYYRLDAQVAHLLLDEFQDTSLEQWEVLWPLAEEIRSFADGSRTFFCVGDVKQAIYAWRGGCAELFAQIEEQLSLPHDPSRGLNVSYRSSPVVLEAVNQVFGELGGNAALAEWAKEAGKWQAAYQSHAAIRQNLPGYVELATTLPSDAADADGAEEEDAGADDALAGVSADPHLRAVAQRISQLQGRAPDKTLGVLVRTNKAARNVLFALRLEGVDASGEGGNVLTDDPAVNAVLAAFTLADHPGDRLAAFHVAASPVGKVVGLTHLADPAAVARVSARIRRQLLLHGYARTLTHWARELAPCCNERSARRLMQLVELAERYEPDMNLRPGSFVDYVGQMTVEEPSPAPVRVMTIHKSKGLEFDIVVLPELTAPLGGAKQAVYVLRAAPTAPIHAVHRSANREVRDLSPQLQEGHRQETARRLQDDWSGLYVAMTRARQGLYMFVPPRKQKSDGTLGKVRCSYAAILRAALTPPDLEESAAGGQILFAHGDPDWCRSTPVAPTPAAAPAPSWSGGVTLPAALPGARTRNRTLVHPSKLESTGEQAVQDLLRMDQPQNRQFGTLIHLWLAQLAWTEDVDRWQDADMLALARRELPEAREEWLRQAAGVLRRWLEQRDIRQLFVPPAGAVELWRERPFLAGSGHRLVQGVFDRVVLRKHNGKVLAADLIDYKTDATGNPGPSLETLTERYRGQIQAYRQSLAHLAGLDEKLITARLAFLSAGQVISLAHDVR